MINNKTYMFISEEKWREFASELLDGEYSIFEYPEYVIAIINESGVSFTGKNISHILCMLTLSICRSIDQQSLWSEFLKVNMNAEENPAFVEEEKHDRHTNDWKP